MSRTMTVKFQVQRIADSDIHNPKKTLIPPLKLALVKYLDGDDGRFLNRSEF
jgi:hypothetical protein